MLNSKEITTNALSIFSTLIAHEDPISKQYSKAKLGRPKLVKNLKMQPFFWIVPVKHRGKVLGHLNLGLDGSLMGQVLFQKSLSDIANLPSVVTWVTAKEALKEARKIVNSYPEAEVREPVYVYDELRGWLAWLITIAKNSEILTSVFVTPNYVYERKPSVKKRDTVIRG